ncbi:M20 family metallopeptidase [Microlunatus sp. GCM10028923]|uniref:M20 family metallopeptidase n=1 Tax=Microlunatus sp. GCM10028923 TaxID=3273400 RepID=UPI0036201A06
MLTDTEQKVLDQIDEGLVTGLASALVQAPARHTPNVNPPGGEAPTVAVLTELAAELGLDVITNEVAPDRSNVSVRLPGGEEPGLLLLGHTDVVPIGEGWTSDPWSGRVSGGRLYGRGSADMKGGLAACLTAMAAIRRAGVALPGPVELAAVVDEEDHGLGIRHFLGNERARFAGCIAAEPTDLQTIIAARGDSYVEFTVTGRHAHSGLPSEGANAIVGAAAVVGAIEQWHTELAASAHLLAGAATWSIGSIAGGSGPTVVAGECTIVADRRLLPGESATAVLEDARIRLGELGLSARGLSVQVRMTMDMPGFETAPGHPLVRTVEGALGDAGGPLWGLGGWTAACDGGFIARDAGIPVVVLGPGSVTQHAHRPNESVPVEELVTAARTYALTALRLIGGAA